MILSATVKLIKDVNVPLTMAIMNKAPTTHSSGLLPENYHPNWASENPPVNEPNITQKTIIQDLFLRHHVASKIIPITVDVGLKYDVAKSNEIVCLFSYQKFYIATGLIRKCIETRSTPTRETVKKKVHLMLAVTYPFETQLRTLIDLSMFMPASLTPYIYLHGGLTLIDLWY